LLAAFKTLLHRYTRQDDIIVGSPMANREQVETESLIGFFINTHALRSNLGGDPTFPELLQRVREVAVGAYAHQEPSIDQVIEAAHPDRSSKRHPLFEVVFGLQTALSEQWELPGLKASRIELDNGGSKFDWTLLATETGDGLRLRCEYSTDLFEAATIGRLMRHFDALLRGIVAQPAQRLSQFPLLSEPERAELIARSAKPVVTCPVTHGLHQWFEAQAASTPDSTAVMFEQERLDYGELNRRANRLARHLQTAGVRAETPVALLLERSTDMVVAILAVLKAGGMYIPMDPCGPTERLVFMLQDTGAPVILTQERLRHLVPATTATIVCLDSSADQIGRQLSENLDAKVTPEAGAYVIYTSGSTGKPKGVVVTHHNVVRLFQETEPWFGFHAGDVWTLFHSYTFDFSVWELWGALLYGGRLLVVPYLVTRSPAEFHALLAREQVTVLNQTPSAFRQLIWAEAQARDERSLALRYVICGGEALELQSLRPWFARHGDQKPQVVNMYGITETTVHVTYRVIRQPDLEGRLGSVIGAPLPGLTLQLLDQNLQPVPPGVPGEICVGGAGVARGYLNRPELTRQRFIADPFGAPGERLYRSGDLARYTARGELEYLGRMDDQVKIRGFRVELGEIESALNRHRAVRESVVIAAEEGSNCRLVAYFVPVDAAPPASSLRAHLLQFLPEYMVPAIFMPLASLPLTVNGKVDRRALPAPKDAPDCSNATGAPPRNEQEKLIAGIWSELLGRPGVGIHDNFFHLGGHSLLATQVISRVCQALRVDLSVRALFENPTVARLAEAAVQARPARELRPLAGSRAPADLLARLDQLSDAEVEVLLRDTELKDLAE
jgi:amino acid adenylation domain-containing protein